MKGPTTEGFLTEYQREVMSAASMEREEEEVDAVEAVVVKGTTNGGPQVPSEHATKHAPPANKHHHVVAAKQERKSHAVRSGRPKKGGSGGKGTWGNPLEPYPVDDAVDPMDPLYDEEEEVQAEAEEVLRAQSALSAPPAGPAAESVSVYKQKVVELVSEYFSSGDVATCAAELTAAGPPKFHHHFVKRLVSASLDRGEREKEMAAHLLSSLYAELLSSEQLSKGFLSLLEALPDLTLDCPDAVPCLALFLARAVTDDILPPAFLHHAKAHAQAQQEQEQSSSSSSSGGGGGDGGDGSATSSGLRLSALKLAEAHLASPAHAEHVERVWGGGSVSATQAAKLRIGALLREAASSGDVAEAAHCIRQLKLPFFHHEVVLQALTLALEQPSASPVLLSLLQQCCQQGVVSSSQLGKGVARLLDRLDDISLDVPGAHRAMAALLASQACMPPLTPEQSRQLEGGQGSGGGEEGGEGGSSNGNGSHAALVAQVKQAYSGIILEYMSTGDDAEVAERLQEVGQPHLLHLFVKRLICTAMDRKLRHKEMASALLSSLFPSVLPTHQLEAAFDALLDSVEDMALDAPGAAHTLALFLARAVVDDVLAPLYLQEAAGRLKESQALALEVIHGCQAMLSARHAGERILRCWGGSGSTRGVSVEDVKMRISALLEEYASGGDGSEACQCIRELGMPFFHHEVVKKAVIMAMEKKEERLIDLLRECAHECLISSSQMQLGLSRVKESLPDLVLDIPNAVEKYESYVSLGIQEGWIGGNAVQRGSIEVN